MKDKINKLILVFKKDGFGSAIKKTTKYIKNRYLSKINPFGIVDFKIHKKQLESNIDAALKSKCDRIILMRSSFGWNVPLFQRPQHIFNNMSNQKCLIFYEVTNMTDDVKYIAKQKDDLFLVNLNNKRFLKFLEDKISNTSKPKYLQIFSTDWTVSIEELKEYENRNFKIIYEYIDDINPKLSGTKEVPKNILDKYEYMLNHDEIYAITTADKLYNIVKDERGEKNLVMSTNGVDYKFFQKYDNFELPAEYLSIIHNGKINMCYYGALASWYDYELVKKIAQTNKYNIILFGIKYDDSYDKSCLASTENVYFLGSIDYKILKYYAREVDILTIPFLVNEITMATSPVKLFEYMSLHKPIVTTDLPECKKYKSVLIGKNGEDFIKKLDEAYKKREDKKYIDLLDKEAKENDWSIKSQAIIDLVKKDEK